MVCVAESVLRVKCDGRDFHLYKKQQTPPFIFPLPPLRPLQPGPHLLVKVNHLLVHVVQHPLRDELDPEDYGGSKGDPEKVPRGAPQPRLLQVRGREAGHGVDAEDEAHTERALALRVRGEGREGAREKAEAEGNSDVPSAHVVLEGDEVGGVLGKGGLEVDRQKPERKGADGKVDEVVGGDEGTAHLLVLLEQFGREFFLLLLRRRPVV
jgi:hypothetical protein